MYGDDDFGLLGTHWCCLASFAHAACYRDQLLTVATLGYAEEKARSTAKEQGLVAPAQEHGVHYGVVEMARNYRSLSWHHYPIMIFHHLLLRYVNARYFSLEACPRSNWSLRQ